MSDEHALSWRDQLSKVRGQVVQMADRRATEKRLQRERNEDSLKERLKEDTLEALNQRAGDIRRNADRAARRFYPLPHIEGVLSELSDFGDLLRFYVDCMKSFGRVFPPAYKTALPELLGDLGSLQRGLDRQLGQWRAIKDIVDNTIFRQRQAEDSPALVAVAKAFSDRAHSVSLSIPGDFFAHEGENFWVAVYEETVLGYVKNWPDDKVVSFALLPAEKANFNKFVRGLLYKFHMKKEIFPDPSPAVRVRVGYVRETKFFTDIGFVRSETLGPSDWIYQRNID